MKEAHAAKPQTNKHKLIMMGCMSMLKYEVKNMCLFSIICLIYCC